jgi:hypothetical protein
MIGVEEFFRDLESAVASGESMRIRGVRTDEFSFHIYLGTTPDVQACLATHTSLANPNFEWDAYESAESEAG